MFVNVNFNMAATAILNFVKLEVWQQKCSRTRLAVSVSNLVQICSKLSELSPS